MWHSNNWEVRPVGDEIPGSGLGVRRQTEGMAFYMGNFYLSDDSAYEVYKYSQLFDIFTTYPIILRAYKNGSMVAMALRV